jgi:hypothetical protein
MCALESNEMVAVTSYHGQERAIFGSPDPSTWGGSLPESKQPMPVK